MLKLPDGLTAETFLARYWQKAPLCMPSAMSKLRPAITRNELAWLATLDDVESRIVFTETIDNRRRYRSKSGPFDPEYLAALPRQGWTLLVHDVEKHLPVMRKLFLLVPFVPDWRIDDLMVSFAAPGGGVGPHMDNYDVFLCQGIGLREWRISASDPGADREASTDLALLREFTGTSYSMCEGDILYLPPGIAHWGTAQRACITYSIGMRAPQRMDLTMSLADDIDEQRFYADPDLSFDEAVPGYISRRAIDRAVTLLDGNSETRPEIARSLGRCVTCTKAWLKPQSVGPRDARNAIRLLQSGRRLVVHGMSRIAYDDRHVYVNGLDHKMPESAAELLPVVCRSRRLAGPLADDPALAAMVAWMLETGAFEIPGNL